MRDWLHPVNQHLYTADWMNFRTKLCIPFCISNCCTCPELFPSGFYGSFRIDLYTFDSSRLDRADIIWVGRHGVRAERCGGSRDGRSRDGREKPESRGSGLCTEHQKPHTPGSASYGQGEKKWQVFFMDPLHQYFVHFPSLKSGFTHCWLKAWRIVPAPAPSIRSSMGNRIALDDYFHGVCGELAASLRVTIPLAEWPVLLISLKVNISMTR